MSIGPDQLIEYFKAAEKPQASFKLGLEQEVMGFDLETKTRVTYEGTLRPILEGFVERFGWQPAYEGENLIGLKRDGANVTMEPGAQLELSCPPLANLTESEACIEKYRKELAQLTEGRGIRWYSLGYDPISKPDDIPLVPKHRYDIMADYLPQFGLGAHHMMKATCTAQTNLDYSSEEDMAKKMLVATALSPFVSILFASSPFRLGGLSGYKNTRNWTWRTLDPARSGFLEFLFKEDFGYKDYIEYALDIPMMVLQREGRILDMRGKSFREFMALGEQGLEPNMEDWATQLGCTFPVARLRNAIETRTADAGPFSLLLAQAAFWKGLLYDQTSLDQAAQMVRSNGIEVFKRLHEKAYFEGFECLVRFPERVQLLERTLELAESGLARLSGAEGLDEGHYLKPALAIFEKRASLSDEMINLYLEQEEKDVFAILDKKDLIFA